MELTARGKKAKGCDLFLSIHSNAVGSYVNEDIDYPAIYHLTDDATTDIDEKSKELAKKFAKLIAETMQTKQEGRISSRNSSNDRNKDGFMNDNYYGVLHGARVVGVPGMILEHSFHTNTRATQWLLNDANLEKMAKAEADLLAEYYGVKKLPEGVYEKGKKTKLSANFNSTEFDCNGDGCCSETPVDPKLVECLQNIRDHFGKAVTINCGYRCEAHNTKIGGAKASRHLKGDAADIKVKDVAPLEVARYAEQIGIKGIGLYETSKDGHFVHVDVRDKKAFWYGQSEEKRDTFQEKPAAPVEPEKPKTKPTVREGSKGDDVRYLQNRLTILGYKPGAIDGIFGTKTKTAVEAFQADNDLAKDGVCGPKTWAALDSAAYYTAEVTASALNVRAGAGTKYSVKSFVKKGDKVIVVSTSGNWARLINDAGWVSLSYIKRV